MKKQWSRVLALMLCLSMMITCMPVNVRALSVSNEAISEEGTGKSDARRETDIPQAIIIPEQEVTVTNTDLADSDVLAERYVNSLFGISTGAGRMKLKAKNATFGSRLSGNEALAYKIIFERIRDIADGNESR